MHQYISSLSVNIYIRWEVIIIQHPDFYFGYIEVSDKIGLYKFPDRLMGGGGVEVACGQIMLSLLNYPPTVQQNK